MQVEELVSVETIEEFKTICKQSKENMLLLPKKIYERSSSKAFLRLFKSVALVIAAYVTLTYLPWYLLPLGWVFVGTTMAGLLAVGYACRNNNFFNNTFINHVVGQICLIPLMIPFESWHAQYEKGKESFKSKITSYLSTSHFWWCASYWQSLTSNIDAYVSLIYNQPRKRLIGNLALLYLFCALFFPLMTYNLGWWGLAKYYLIPLLVYHFWASSFLKTSSLMEMLEIQESDLTTLVYYKYPQWVEFLSGELNYAFSSLRAFVRPDEGKPDSQDGAASPASDDTPRDIPYYNLKEAIKYIKERKEAIEVRCQELSFVSLLKSRTGDLIQLKDKAKDVIAEKLSKVSWVTSIYLFLTPTLFAYGLLVCPMYWQTWALFFVHYVTGGLGITAGYHRLWSHRSYKAHPIVKNMLLFFSTGCFQMSVLEWCIDHRAHHRYTDTDKDPYSINKGFWYAHMGWLLVKREVPVVADVSDLEKDAAIRFQHKYYPILAVLQGFILPMVIAGVFWGDWLGGLLIAGIGSRVIVSHATFFVNSLAHYWGSFTYSDQRSPRDSWLVGLVTFGEGYHNFHHEFPYDYRNGAHYKAFDPTKWIIWTLSWVGLTYDLMMFSQETITKGKLQMNEKELKRQMAALHWGPPEQTLPTWTMEQVLQFGKEGEKLMVCEGYVHDVRAFLDEHPAGAGIMKPYLNKDVTRQFNGSVYNHSNAARNILRTLRVAKLADAASTSSTSSSSTPSVEETVTTTTEDEILETPVAAEKLKVL